MLQYVYWGTTMPPAAHEALRKQIQIVYDLAIRASDEGEPIVLDWFYMDAKTVRTILPRLRFWLDEGPSVCPHWVTPSNLKLYFSNSVLHFSSSLSIKSFRQSEIHVT